MNKNDYMVYYNVHQGEQFLKGFETLPEAIRFAQGQDLITPKQKTRIETVFSHAVERVDVVEGNYCVEHKDFGLFSSFGNKRHVIFWHKAGDNRKIKVFKTNLSAKKLADEVGGRVRILVSGNEVR